MTEPDGVAEQHHGVAEQHHGVTVHGAVTLGGPHRPRPGAITIVPATHAAAHASTHAATHSAADAGPDPIVEAVLSAGGDLVPLGPQTRGLIWLTNDGADALESTLDTHPAIDWVQLPFAGVDAFAGLLHSYSDRPLPLWTSAKGAYAQPVAEHALTLALSLLRVIPERARATSWPTGPKTGTSLYGLSVLIVGAGGIAIELIRLLQPFGVHVTVVRRSPGEVAGAERSVTAERLLEELPHADVVVIAAASTAETRHLFGAAEFAAMMSSAVIVNIARGGLIDSDALVAALTAGEIAGAGLDVTDPEPLPDGHPLWFAPNILITPHSADTPAMTGPLLAERIRANVEGFLGDGAFVGIVDARAGY